MDHGGIAQHLLGGPVGDLAAARHHKGAPHDRAHGIKIVVDQHDRIALGIERADARDDLLEQPRMHAGEGFVELIGPNGSGKTTTINMVAGALKPDAGAIALDGRDIVGMPAFRFARAGIGRTFQVPRLFKRMTVIENLVVPALTGARTSGREAFGRAREILAFLKFEHLADA